jgi:predicted branched-subunit amino acid permease
MDVLLSASNGVVAILLLKETGWRSAVPALLMCMLVGKLERVQSPQPALLAVAISACVVVLLARGPRLLPMRLCAVLACSLATATVHVLDRL